MAWVLKFVKGSVWDQTNHKETFEDVDGPLFRKEGMSVNTAVLYLTEDAANRALNSMGGWKGKGFLKAVDVRTLDLENISSAKYLPRRYVK